MKSIKLTQIPLLLTVCIIIVIFGILTHIATYRAAPREKKVNLPAPVVLSNQTTFAWDSDTAYPYYTIAVNKEPHLGKAILVVDTEVSYSCSYSIKKLTRNLNPGKYFLWVKGMSPDFESGKWSEPFPIVIPP
jgi:hypothetical protein